VVSEKVFHLPLRQIGGINQMTYPKYGDWCKKNVIETIRKQRIYEEKEYLEDFIFNPNSDLYSSGIYDYEVDTLLWIINGDDPDDLSNSLFSAVQYEFAEKYFHMAQEMNPGMDMKTIRNNGGDYLKLLSDALNNITIDELKNTVMYAFEHGTEEIVNHEIQYMKTTIGNVVNVIKSGLAEIGNAHIDYLDPKTERKEIPVNEFKKYLLHLNQSGIFADTVSWRYVDLFESGNYGLECDIGHNNGFELNAVIFSKNEEDKDRVNEILRESEE